VPVFNAFTEDNIMQFTVKFELNIYLMSDFNGKPLSSELEFRQS
jgi:hypothetical protein